MKLDRLSDFGPFFIGGMIFIINPFQPMRGNFPARLLHRRGDAAGGLGSCLAWAEMD